MSRSDFFPYNPLVEDVFVTFVKHNKLHLMERDGLTLCQTSVLNREFQAQEMRETGQQV